MKILKAMVLMLSMGGALSVWSSPESELIDRMKSQQVVIGSGFSFGTGMPIVFSPYLSKEIQPCDEVMQPAGDDGCAVEIVEDDQTAPILSAIKAGQTVIHGKIRKQGKELPARFFVTVTALYEGSECGVQWILGRKYYCCNGVCVPI